MSKRRSNRARRTPLRSTATRRRRPRMPMPWRSAARPLANSTAKAVAYDADAAAAAVASSMGEGLSLVPPARDRLLTLAQSTDNLAKAMDASDLAALGIKVVE